MPKYLDISEQIATDHIIKVVTAATLSTEIDPKHGKVMRDLARAVKGWTEVREYQAAVDVAEQLHKQFESTPAEEEAQRVITRSLEVLRRRAA